MAPAQVVNFVSTPINSVSSVQLTINNLVGGNYLVLVVRLGVDGGVSHISSVADNNGNSYTLQWDTQTGPVTQILEIAIYTLKIPPNTFSLTITVTFDFAIYIGGAFAVQCANILGVGAAGDNGEFGGFPTNSWTTTPTMPGSVGTPVTRRDRGSLLIGAVSTNVLGITFTASQGKVEGQVSSGAVALIDGSFDSLTGYMNGAPGQWVVAVVELFGAFAPSTSQTYYVYNDRAGW